jgi:hypothetical protein
VLAASTIYVHFRGKQRLRIARQLGDHSIYLAPYNVLMYVASAVPNNCSPVRRRLQARGGEEQRLGYLLVLQERLETLLPEMVR